MSRLGVLSIHLDGEPCRVGCPFCYLGARAPLPLVALRRGPPPPAGHALVELEAALARLDFAELAIAVSEPVDLAVVLRLCAAGRRRARPVAITTTAEIVAAQPALLGAIDRLNLSVDPWKVEGDAQAVLDRIASVATAARAQPRSSGAPPLEIIAIATLSTPGFAELLVGGLLEALVELPALSGVALSALKPPPPFCDRGFWLSTLARLGPLLERHLDRRLFLDCFVAARLLDLGGCPGRPDLSLVPATGGAATMEFRACVYAARPDRLITLGDELDELARGFVPPAVCPFDTRLSE